MEGQNGHGNGNVDYYNKIKQVWKIGSEEDKAEINKVGGRVGGYGAKSNCFLCLWDKEALQKPQGTTGNNNERCKH